MINKILGNISKLILGFLIVSNLVSCQNKSQPKQISNSLGFYIQDSLTYYNGQKFNIVGPIKDFVDIIGKADRIVIDSSGGNTNKSWKWNKSGFYAFLNKRKKVEVYNLNIDNPKIEKEYNNIDEAVKVLGNFDEYKEDKIPLDIRKYHVWDKLGIEVYVTEKDEINCIYLHTLHYSKTKEISKEELENTDLVYNNAPKQEYKGMFTYNGHTVDFSKMGYDNWFKTVKGLNIEGESYEPPGDSKEWSRIISERNLSVEMLRDINELGSTDGFHVSEIGVVNAVKYIQISN
ncbi:DUF7738 domain-containing protein [Flavobacterium terrae]|uniref:DUF7738 domain-containing protein n=1 Tax=Flavobacterium terrae TaxID=415425 RepID=A0A1M6EQY6_9FLAO|nr:hypothetical protein [Flavobacterium terrae]SHI87875.1 hypothetical protein SAMN05444363_1910 [Flavobacterium terrae]